MKLLDDQSVKTRFRHAFLCNIMWFDHIVPQWCQASHLDIRFITVYIDRQYQTVICHFHQLSYTAQS